MSIKYRLPSDYTGDISNGRVIIPVREGIADLGDNPRETEISFVKALGGEIIREQGPKRRFEFGDNLKAGNIQLGYEMIVVTDGIAETTDVISPDLERLIAHYGGVEVEVKAKKNKATKATKTKEGVTDGSTDA